MNKRFIKMNNNKNYLSLGNLFNIIKKYSKVSASSVQTEIFCALFDINNINNTTVNNYLIGYRAIGFEYKKIYLNLKDKYLKDKLVFKNIFCNILTILDEFIYKDITLVEINKNNNLNKVCKSLLDLCKEDVNVSNVFYQKVYELYNSNDLYDCFIEFLFYTILENKQPIFNQNIDINFRKEELSEYLRINLFEGISYISSLMELSKKDNIYANAELGSLEYSGLISGKKDYEKSYNYYIVAAKKDHPKACWMVANLIFKKLVKEDSIELMWYYLEKAIKLGNIAAINTMGNCYMSLRNPDYRIDEEKALTYYLKASEYNYSYAFNNLGLYYERNNNSNESIKYFKLSADLSNSWALNKVGEIKRLEGNLKDAYYYYLKSIDTPINERNFYGYYNLAKYYYLGGFKELNIKKDKEKAIKYLNIAKDAGIKKAANLLNQIKSA